ncbi:hypothetical protein [Microbacterium sp. UFMG61]|uniref:hypothetical protein n=1 Tax=Microbacterium sp. UFMG61 TaxID=2745935 RepID=UPI0018904EB2|nr:hypothetical protein [Microbacterium sp. UFMG61]
MTVSGTQQRPGTPATTSTPGIPGTRNADTPDTSTEPARPSDRAIRLADCMDDSGTVRCHEPTRPGEPSPLRENGAPAAPATPTITITDLARFAPPPVSAKAEPGNVGIADLPTNFTTTATTHTQAGELFGIPLTVRFTPDTYAYDYGDGTTATLTAPGQTWEALGLPQFSPTAATHVYRERGEYSVILITGYTVEIDLGTGWIPLAGQITTTGTPQTIRILEARTALVAHTCTEDPDGIGC